MGRLLAVKYDFHVRCTFNLIKIQYNYCTDHDFGLNVRSSPIDSVVDFKHLPIFRMKGMDTKSSIITDRNYRLQ